jgi:RNA polymerase sigma factor (sigma-70 family)
MHPSSRALLERQPDDRLVELVGEGDERAFDAIVQRYRHPLLRYCQRMVSPSRAEDAVQQTFINAYRSLTRGADAPVALRPWLYRIAHNAALNIVRDHHVDLDELPDTVGSSARTEDVVEGRDAVKRLVVALKALPDNQREVIVRRELGGDSNERIAADLGMTSGAVRQLVYRARSGVRAAAAAIVPGPVWRWLPWGGAPPGGEDMIAGAAAGGVAAVVTKAVAGLVVAGTVAGASVQLADVGGRSAKAPARVQRTTGPAPSAAVSPAVAVSPTVAGTPTPPRTGTARERPADAGGRLRSAARPSNRTPNATPGSTGTRGRTPATGADPGRQPDVPAAPGDRHGGSGVQPADDRRTGGGTRSDDHKSAPGAVSQHGGGKGKGSGSGSGSGTDPANRVDDSPTASSGVDSPSGGAGSGSTSGGGSGSGSGKDPTKVEDSVPAPEPARPAEPAPAPLVATQDAAPAGAVPATHGGPGPG